MASTDSGDGWSPETTDQRTKAYGTFVLMMSLWLPFIGLLAGVAVRGFCWAAGF